MDMDWLECEGCQCRRTRRDLPRGDLGQRDGRPDDAYDAPMTRRRGRASWRKLILHLVLRRDMTLMTLMTRPKKVLPTESQWGLEIGKARHPRHPQKLSAPCPGVVIACGYDAPTPERVMNGPPAPHPR